MTPPFGLNERSRIPQLRNAVFVIKMIICDKLTKSYGTMNVFNSFSYKFDNQGFYLLLGESGSGKTTLLNVLSGMISYEGGQITVGDQIFEGRVNPNSFVGGIDYITQDPFFVDFLSVRENMRLSLDDENAIEATLKKFGLFDQKELLTTVLSGGERQRLALARSLLTQKKVIFLDEPTASLDKNNKHLVFSLIKELSKTCLVICASHDLDAQKYADKIIQIKKPKEGFVKERKPEKILEKYELSASKSKKELSIFMKKWFVSKQRSKKNDLFLGVFLVLAMMLCLLSDTPQTKMDSNIEYVYKINSLLLETKSDETEFFTSLEGKFGITDVVLLYNGSIPTAMPQLEDGIEIPLEEEYESVLYAIPFSAESFRLSSKIEVGTYFQEKNDIILSSEMANALSPEGDWSSLVGMTIPIKVYRKGTIDFRVVGIFGEMNDFERQYLSSASTNMSSGDAYNPNDYVRLFYINSMFMDDYMFDDTFYRGEGQRSYQLYFDSYKSMKEYMKSHDEMYGTVRVGTITNGVYDVFALMSCVLLPLTFLIMLLALLYYGNLIGTEMTYNSRFISAFNYVGYDVRDVIRCFGHLNTQRITGISLTSAGVTLVVTAIINYINSKEVFIGFQIFTYNPIMIVIFVLLLSIFSLISVKMVLRRMKEKTWYENIIASRDLL